MGWMRLTEFLITRNISTSLSLPFLFSALTLAARHLWWWWVNHDGGIRDVWVALLRPNVPVLGHWALGLPVTYPLESNASDSACCFLFPVSYPANSAVRQATT
ncbi:uncharacterized protein B0J16DRAFT_334039 [Fusarium flagelliforme]|uniref:uncharacterized protein n=1 Tax=Fusarium flagelliforme TaxID=2675880 RepID=UPI001E8D8E7B|nr:uncharacterized protein B0J16DRAFT_334039 [Fusarium flagelliforme]KAH7192966.1 hypothetical protein B0J16DRAFT_334039 [Fusarium flagelliforme]